MRRVRGIDRLRSAAARTLPLRRGEAHLPTLPDPLLQAVAAREGQGRDAVCRPTDAVAAPDLGDSALARRSPSSAAAPDAAELSRRSPKAPRGRLPDLRRGRGTNNSGPSSRREFGTTGSYWAALSEIGRMRATGPHAVGPGFVRMLLRGEAVQCNRNAASRPGTASTSRLFLNAGLRRNRPRRGTAFWEPDWSRSSPGAAEYDSPRHCLGNRAYSITLADSGRSSGGASSAGSSPVAKCSSLSVSSVCFMLSATNST